MKMKESDMKTLMPKKTNIEDGRGDEENNPSNMRTPFLRVLFLLFFLGCSGTYMGYVIWKAVYKLCATSPTKPMLLLDEKCYFLISTERYKSILIEKLNGNPYLFRIIYAVLTKVRNDYYHPDPIKVIACIYVIAFFVFIARLYYICKRTYYSFDYFSILDSYLLGLAFYLVFKMLQFIFYSYFYLEKDCFQMFS